MPNDSRTILISNLHRDETSDINNQISVTLPDGIFSGKVEAINLKHLYIDFDYETIGTSNYEIIISYPSTSNPVKIQLNINYYLSTILKTDEQIADLLANSINNALGTTVFNVYYNNYNIYINDVYRDNSNLLANYTIYTSNNVEFNLDFSSTYSIGPLLGFGNMIYTGNNTYTGGNIPPIGAYESIKISNAAYNPTLKLYDQYTDFSCKMNLYNSEGILISNISDDRDTTISLPITNGYIYSPYELCTYLEIELNKYSSNFDDSVFSVEFSYDTYKFTFTNSKNKKFGIGFRFDRGNGYNNYGSMHRILGFNKKIYLGVTSITSLQQALIFDNCYTNDYIMICSDLIKNNFDTSLIIAGSNNSASMYESLFTIPVTEIKNNSYIPLHKQDYRIRIHASKLAKLYNENSSTKKAISFYLKSSTGRHIKLNTQWTLEIEIEYSN